MKYIIITSCFMFILNGCGQKDTKSNINSVISNDMFTDNVDTTSTIPSSNTLSNIEVK